MRDADFAGAITADQARLQVTVTARCAVLEIRSWLPEQQRGERPLKLDGRDLPVEVGATLAGPLRMLSLAPGEWLLVSDQQAASSILPGVAAGLGGQDAVVVDMTDGFARLEIRGVAARHMLSKGCGLDFHPQAWPVGRCARTRFAQLPVVIDHIDAEPRFDLYVARSYVRFLTEWIDDSAAGS